MTVADIILPEHLKLQQGSQLVLTDQKDKGHPTIWEVIHIEKMEHTVLIHFVPVNTPVANASIFHYGRFLDYEVAKY